MGGLGDQQHPADWLNLVDLAVGIDECGQVQPARKQPIPCGESCWHAEAHDSLALTQ